MRLDKLSVRACFAWMIGVLAGGMAIFGVMAWFTLQQLQVNGPLYQRIVQGKDIIADVLPPPEYIIESYLVSLQLSHPLRHTPASYRRGGGFRNGAKPS